MAAALWPASEVMAAPAPRAGAASGGAGCSGPGGGGAGGGGAGSGSGGCPAGRWSWCSTWSCPSCGAAPWYRCLRGDEDSEVRRRLCARAWQERLCADPLAACPARGGVREPGPRRHPSRAPAHRSQCFSSQLLSQAPRFTIPPFQCTSRYLTSLLPSINIFSLD